MLTELRKFKTLSDDDNIRFKQKIKKSLLNNPKVLHVLNNPDLDECDPDDYYGINIKPYLVIPDVQTTPMNYICFMSNFDDLSSYNDTYKNAQIIFVIMCDEKTVNDKETGLARHDLLSALIQEEFNWTNIFGTQCKIVSNKESTTDKNYCTRTLVFELTTPNNVLKNNHLISGEYR